MSEDMVVHLFTLARAAREASRMFVPIVFWMNQDGEVSMVLAPHDNDGGLPTAFRGASGMLLEAEGFPVWVAMAVDAYGRLTDADEFEGGERIGAGTLDARFWDGDGRVVEQIMIIIASPNDTARVYRQVYRYTPVDGWEWDAEERIIFPVLPDQDLLGAMELVVSDPTGSMGS